MNKINEKKYKLKAEIKDFLKKILLFITIFTLTTGILYLMIFFIDMRFTALGG